MSKLNAFVYIIESPADIDMLEDRKQGLALGEALGLAQIPYCYNLVTTQNSFEIALYDRLDEAIKYYNTLPILHFTMHGDSQKEGIILTDKSHIKWNQLSQYLTPITQELGSLLVCMSSCYGSQAHQMAFFGQEISYLFLIGNNDSVTWSDATVAYITFYHLLFKLGFNSLLNCYDIMKKASGNEHFDLWEGEYVRQKYINALIQAEINKQQRLQRLREYFAQRKLQ